MIHDWRWYPCGRYSHRGSFLGSSRQQGCDRRGKHLRPEKRKIYLASENPDYPPLVITDVMDFEVWGVVTNVIHPL